MRHDKLQQLAPRYHAIRTSVADEAAIHHVAGQSTFTDDLPELAGTLHVALGRSTIASGRLARLDFAAVEAMPDVVMVLTAKDIPGANDASPNRTDDQPIIGEGDIAFAGQVLFAIVARSRRAAERAVAAAEVATTPSLPTIALDDALATHATLLADYGLERGDPTDEIRRCERKVFGQWRAGSQAPAQLEPHAAIAIPGEGGSIHVVAASETPSLIHLVVSEMLDVSASGVTVEARRVSGGANGQRSASVQWAALAALAAWRSGRPCRIVVDKDVEMGSSGRRQNVLVDYSAGFNGSGLVSGVEATIATRCGSGVDNAVETNDRIVLSADNAYHYPALRLLSRRMRTNTPPGLWCRASGLLEGSFVAERLMDHIAISLGVDPLDVRKTNLYASGRDRTPYGTAVDGGVLRQLVGELERTSEYRRRRRDLARFNQTSPILKRGLALVPVKAGIGAPQALGNEASVLIQLHHDGSISLTLSAVDAGRGIATRAAQITAEEFGIRHTSVKIGAPSTQMIGSPPASGADPALLAVIDGCHAVKDRLYDFVEATMQVDRERVEFRDGRVRLGGRQLDFAELVWQATTANVPLTATGYHTTTVIDWDRTRAVGNPFHYYALGAACAEVSIDIMTGEHVIERLDILQDAGRSLNPALDVGAIEGGFAFGLGWLTTEELLEDSAGRPLGHAADYAIPLVSDIPSDFRVSFFQTAGAREETPYRSKDIEDAAVPLAISVFSAITDAISAVKPGTMPRLNAPATPEAIVRAVRSMTE